MTTNPDDTVAALTKREFFACAAMQMLLHPGNLGTGVVKNKEDLMGAAVAAADGLIAALNVGQGN